jgi:hypothetical protein
MANHYGNMVADAASVGIRYAGRLLKDMPENRFARLATLGDQTVFANHPAFAVGHLCLYPVKVVQLLGQDTSQVQPPANYESLFSKDASCQDDPQGTIYPHSSELISQFLRTYDVAILALRSAEDSQLTAENPVDSPMKQICPTLGSMLTFYMTGHVTTHLGQISTWRRIEGLPPA